MRRDTRQWALLMKSVVYSSGQYRRIILSNCENEIAEKALGLHWKLTTLHSVYLDLFCLKRQIRTSDISKPKISYHSF